MHPKSYVKVKSVKTFLASYRVVCEVIAPIEALTGHSALLGSLSEWVVQDISSVALSLLKAAKSRQGC